MPVQLSGAPQYEEGWHWQVPSEPQVSPDRQPRLQGTRQTPIGCW